MEAHQGTTVRNAEAICRYVLTWTRLGLHIRRKGLRCSLASAVGTRESWHTGTQREPRCQASASMASITGRSNDGAALGSAVPWSRPRVMPILRLHQYFLFIVIIIGHVKWCSDAWTSKAFVKWNAPRGLPNSQCGWKSAPEKTRGRSNEWNSILFRVKKAYCCPHPSLPQNIFFLLLFLVFE